MAAKDRQARLAAELRLNLARRKAQMRARRAGEADERPEGLGGVEDGEAHEATVSGEASEDAAEEPR